VGEGGSSDHPGTPGRPERPDRPYAADRPDRALRLLLDDSAEDLYENAPCGYLSVLLDGTIVKVNQTFLEWTGRERGDLVGRVRFPTLLTVGGRIFYETHLAPMLRLRGGLREIALEVLHADGRSLPVLVNSRVRTDDTGAPVLVRIMVLDARERTAYERELLRTRQAAEESEARTRAVQQVTADLAAATSVDDAARAVERAGTRLAGAFRSEVWLLHPETRELALHGASPARGAAERARLLAETLQQGEPVFAGPPELVPDRVARVLLPLVVDTGRLGVLRLELEPPRPVPAGERAALVTLAAQGALALSRAHLHEQTVLAAARSGFLARLGRELQEEPSVLDRARRLAELAAQETADAAVVLLGRPGAWRAVAALPVGLRDPSGSSGDPAGGVPADWVAAADRAVGTDSPQALAEPADGASPPAETVPGVVGTRVVLPLRARGRPLGALVLTRRSEPFWTSELVHLVDVAERGGLALENARLYEREHGVAHTLQRSLLPGRLPDDPRLELAPHYRPAVEGLDVGGDWYDAFPVAQGVLGVVVGDVVGRGIGAASAMGQLRSAVRALATDGLGPARLLERLDTFVDQADAARMSTLAYLQVDAATGQARYACAGHPPLVVLEPGQPPRLEWGGRSAPVGSRARADRRGELALALPPGGRLLLYTDGLVERRRRPLAHGLADLVSAVDAHRAAPLVDLVDAVARDLAGGAAGLDDICVLALARRALGPLELVVPPRPDRVSAARADLRAWLAGGGVGRADTEAIVLAASEAIANAVEHGCRDRPGSVVRLSASEVGGDVEIRVGDPGAWPEPRGPRPAARPRVLGGLAGLPEGDAERGRGLFLMRELADAVWVERDGTGEAGGTTVVLRRRVRAREPR
jgi:serine/threonine-protein kinase RsbW